MTHDYDAEIERLEEELKVAKEFYGHWHYRTIDLEDEIERVKAERALAAVVEQLAAEGPK